MFDLSSLIIYSVATAICWFAYKVYVWPYYLSPLRNMPGPPSDSLIYGSFNTIFSEEAGEPYIRWVKKYGSYFKYHGLLNRPALVVTDPKSIQEILVSEAYNYAKCNQLRGDLARIVGRGLSSVEGDVHKKQRKMMNPAFTHRTIKNMVPTFVQVGLVLKGLISDKVDKGESRMILGTCISKATLDIIGLVGFDHRFNTLTSPSELAKAYSIITDESSSMLNFIISVLANYVPYIRMLPLDLNKEFNSILEIVERESQKIIDEKFEADKKNQLGKNDLLSTLININKTLPVEEKMTDQELKYQSMTFLIAGHATTSYSLSWALLMAAQHPLEQDLLREELVKTFPDKSKFNPTFDGINALEYLDCFVKETLRLFPSVSVLQRNNTKDTFLGEHFIKKDTQIDIPIIALHRLPSVWGPTADDFDPKRWLDLSSTRNVTNYNYLPFNTGVRACIGYKMALCEFKILLTMLVRNFVFRPVEGLHIKKSVGIFAKPDSPIELMVSNVEM